MNILKDMNKKGTTLVSLRSSITERNRNRYFDHKNIPNWAGQDGKSQPKAYMID